MPRDTVSESETTRLTITWSKQADLALRSYLGSQGMKKGDISKFIEEAVRWRIFHQTIQQAREAFVDVPPNELQKTIDEAVDDVRGRRYRELRGSPRSRKVRDLGQAARSSTTGKHQRQSCAP